MKANEMSYSVEPQKGFTNEVSIDVDERYYDNCRSAEIKFTVTKGGNPEHLTFFSLDNPEQVKSLIEALQTYLERRGNFRRLTEDDLAMDDEADYLRSLNNNDSN